jgi:hypothetical protein
VGSTDLTNRIIFGKLPLDSGNHPKGGTQMDKTDNAILNTPQEILSYKFRYHGIVRHVDNITFDGNRQQFIGMEIRKNGKFSNRIKRFTLNEVEGPLMRIEPINRTGALERP